jgi:hypothetical protein
MNLGPLSVVAVDPANQSTTDLGTFAYTPVRSRGLQCERGIVTIPLAAGSAADAADNDLQLRTRVAPCCSPKRRFARSPMRRTLISAKSRPRARRSESTTAVRPRRCLFRLSSSDDDRARRHDRRYDSDDAPRERRPLFPVNRTKGGIVCFVPSPGAPIHRRSGDQHAEPQLPLSPHATRRREYWPAAPELVANWSAMAPCVDNWLMLDDPAQLKAYAAEGSANFEHFLFMPPLI